LLEPIAAAFGVSVPELISGIRVKNANVSANMIKSKFYVCPVCGNGLFYLDVLKGIDDRDKSFDDVEERRALERAADNMFWRT
jgi:hypothetical protein